MHILTYSILAKRVLLADFLTGLHFGSKIV